MLAGSLVGVVLALTGAGGGVLAVPLLVLALGVDVQHAAPLALVAVGSSASIGAAIALRQGKLRYRAALLMGAAGMLAAPFGISVASKVAEAPLALGFAALLAWTGARIFLRDRETRLTPAAGLPCTLDPSTGRFTWTPRCAGVLASTGAVAGFLGGLLGVGGGFVIVPSLSRFSDVEFDVIVSTSLAVIALVSLGATASSAVVGTVSWQLAGPFAVSAASTLLVARRFAAQLPRKAMQQCFAALCLATAAFLAVRGTHSL